MNLQKLSLSTIALAIIATITYFVKSSDSSAPQDPRVGSSIVANEALDSVTTLEMISGTESMTFHKDETSALWLLQEQNNLPANAKQISDLITKLKDTKLERVASTKPARIADFGFGVDSINLVNAAGNSVLSLDLGRETDKGKQLVRFADEDIAFIASDSFTVNGDPTSWLDKTLLEVPRDDIRSATFTLANGDTLAITRESDTAEWTTTSELPSGKQLDQGAITRALNRFAKVSFTKIPDPNTLETALGATAQTNRLSLTLANGTNYKISLSRTPEVRASKEVESTNDAGETVTETKDVVETPAGPVLITVASSDPQDRASRYGERPYEVGAFLFTNLPATTNALLADLPAEKPDATEE